MRTVILSWGSVQTKTTEAALKYSDPLKNCRMLKGLERATSHAQKGQRMQGQWKNADVPAHQSDKASLHSRKCPASFAP